MVSEGDLKLHEGGNCKRYSKYLGEQTVKLKIHVTVESRYNTIWLVLQSI